MHSRTNHRTGTPRQSRQGWRHIMWRVVAVAALGLALAIPHPGQAKTFHCGTGDVACLIAAITKANANGQQHNTIRLEAGTYTLTEIDNTTDGPNGLPSVTSPITLQGVGADQSVIARPPSAPLFRLLDVAPTGALTVQGLTLTGGGVSTFSFGGGIHNEGTLVLRASRLANNGSGAGGGLANFGGQVTIKRSELVSNRATHLAGGLYTSGGMVTIDQSTFAANAADGGEPLTTMTGPC